MVLGWIWTGLIAISIFSAAITGRGAGLAAAAMRGAQSGVTVALSMAGGLCLWSGVGRLLEANGVMETLSRLLDPVLGRVFPDSRKNPILRKSLCGNVCANLLGLGNAATPMGIRAALGCPRPFDILPAVWLTSLLSAGLGVAAATVLGKLWKS